MSFDQDCYLIMSVAVCGSNGWFEDGLYSKPWVDASNTTARDFYRTRDQWLPTWEKSGQMEVRSVRLW